MQEPNIHMQQSSGHVTNVIIENHDSLLIIRLTLSAIVAIRDDTERVPNDGMRLDMAWKVLGISSG